MGINSVDLRWEPPDLKNSGLRFALLAKASLTSSIAFDLFTAWWQPSTCVWYVILSGWNPAFFDCSKTLKTWSNRLFWMHPLMRQVKTTTEGFKPNFPSIS